jgi:UDP-N-acetylmuramate--alanine ligase
MNDKANRSIYIIGIGGKGLNSVAEFCISKGYQVSGSDIKSSPEVISLQQKGIQINLEQVADNVTGQVDTVVYSSIIRDDHPELAQARALGIRTLSRAEFLAELTSEHVRISVAGSHGKSTTSAMATLALQSELGSVNAIVGAYIKELGSYQSSGDSEYCVLEACEYGKSFLHIPGDYTIITSLEKSHMEYFGSEERMNEAFREFVGAHAKDATLIINGDTYALRELCSRHEGPVVTCGFNTSNDFVIRDVQLHDSYSRFSIYKGDACLSADVVVRIPGTYNILNAVFVLILLQELGLDSSGFLEVLQKFTGVGRRFEISRHDQAVFVDDFAHHPTQVRNLLKGLKQFFPDKNILAVFEPRQFHLIRTFLKEYGKAFALASEVCITNVVPALGDTPEDINSLTAHDVLESVATYSKPGQVWHAGSYEEIAERLGHKDLSQTVVATIGAGNIFRVRDLLVNRVQ